MTIIISKGSEGNTAKITSQGYLMVSIDGYTLKDMAETMPGLNIQLFATNKEGNIVPLTLEHINEQLSK